MAHPYHADFWIAAATVAPVVLIAHAVVAADLGKKIAVLKAGSRSGWRVTWYALAAAALLAGGLLAWEAFSYALDALAEEKDIFTPGAVTNWLTASAAIPLVQVLWTLLVAAFSPEPQQ